VAPSGGGFGNVASPGRRRTPYQPPAGRQLDEGTTGSIPGAEPVLGGAPAAAAEPHRTVAHREATAHAGAPHRAVDEDGVIVSREPGKRRLKAIALTGAELWLVFTPRLLALAVVKRAIALARRRRHVTKLFAAGLGRLCFRRRARSVATVKVLALGLCTGARRRRLAEAARVPVFALGLLGVLGSMAKLERAADLCREKKRQAKEKKQRDKEAAKAARSRRFVRWQSIAEKDISAGSMWAGGASELEDDAPVDADALASQEDAIVKEFTIDNTKTKAGEAKPKGPETVSVLDAKDRKTAELVLSVVGKKLTFAMLCDALESLDPERIGGVEVAQRLLRAEACYQGSLVERARAMVLEDGQRRSVADEYIMRVVGQVPMALERLQFISSRASFDDVHDRAFAMVDRVRACLRELLASQTYRWLLTRVVLPLGNKLRGLESAAFRITDLPKLHTTKNSQGTTFLAVVVRFCLENCPLLIDLEADFPVTLSTPVNMLSLDDAGAAIREVRRELKPAEALAAASGDGSLNAVAAALVARELAAATGRCDILEADLASAHDELEQLCEYLAELPDSITLKEIFSSVRTFIGDLKATLANEERRQQAQARRKKAEAARLAAVPKPSAPSTPPPEAGAPRADSQAGGGDDDDGGIVSDFSDVAGDARHVPAGGDPSGAVPSESFAESSGAVSSGEPPSATSQLSDSRSRAVPGSSRLESVAEADDEDESGVGRTSARPSTRDAEWLSSVASPLRLSAREPTERRPAPPPLAPAASPPGGSAPIARHQILHHEALAAKHSPIALGRRATEGGPASRLRRGSMLVSMCLRFAARAAAGDGAGRTRSRRGSEASAASLSPDSRRLSARASSLMGEGRSAAALVGADGTDNEQLKALDSALETWATRRVSEAPHPEPRARRATLAL